MVTGNITLDDETLLTVGIYQNLKDVVECRTLGIVSRILNMWNVIP